MVTHKIHLEVKYITLDKKNPDINDSFSDHFNQAYPHLQETMFEADVE